jgi:alanyl-tRNA synthetase
VNPFERDTAVTFPDRGLAGDAVVLAVVELEAEGRRCALVVDETPFHPLDHRWPDQPADTGTAELLGQRLPVLDCVVGAAPIGGTGVHVAEAIPARRGEEGWAWLVLHVVELDPALAARAVGAPVRLSVDGARRRLLSGAHTACHLSGFAVNAALAGRWRKPVGPDVLGSPDFEKQALASSSLSELRYHDTYRIGRSLRKAGFDSEDLAAAVPSLAAAIEERVLGWVATAAPVRLDAAGPGLGAPRAWCCELPSGEVRVPCGGTHLTDLGELASVGVEVSLSPAGDLLEVTGTVELRDGGRRADRPAASAASAR